MEIKQAASVVVRDEAGRILMVQRGEPPEVGRWSLPGGSVEEGETAQQAAIREALEETGLRVRINEELPATSMPGPNGACFEISPFLATVVGGELEAGDDAVSVGWFSTQDLSATPMTPGLASYLQVAGVLTPEEAGPLRVAAALKDAHIDSPLRRYGRANSLEEAAEMRGVAPSSMVKTLVVRKQEGEYFFVLVPGHRQISWPKLRALLNVNRLSLPDAAQAMEVTGFERGTITPFGSLRPWPVIIDESLDGPVVLGAGGHGLSVTVEIDDVESFFDAQIADVTEPS